jgi:hypothetical protein
MPFHFLALRLLKTKLQKAPKTITTSAKAKTLVHAAKDVEELSEGEEEMVVKDFVAHVTKKVPTRVKFETRSGKKVQFTAEKPKRIKTHVRFATRKP